MKKKKTIYYLDDDHEDLGFFKEITEELGHTVKVFSDGRKMLLVLEIQAEKPDVIFLDIHMPVLNGEEILACEQASVAVTLPKPQTSGAKSAGRFGKPDFVYLAKDDVYRCPAGEKLSHHFTVDEDGQKMRIYLTKACRTCPLKDQCTTSNERRIRRWEHEHVVEAAQTRLDQNPQAMRVRRETVEHPFATLKMRMGATHFLMKRLSNVATEMALNVLSYNLTRVLNILGVEPLLAARRA